MRNKIFPFLIAAFLVGLFFLSQMNKPVWATNYNCTKHLWNSPQCNLGNLKETTQFCSDTDQSIGCTSVDSTGLGDGYDISCVEDNESCAPTPTPDLSKCIQGTSPDFKYNECVACNKSHAVCQNDSGYRTGDDKEDSACASWCSNSAPTPTKGLANTPTAAPAAGSPATAQIPQIPGYGFETLAAGALPTVTGSDRWWFWNGGGSQVSDFSGAVVNSDKHNGNNSVKLHVGHAPGPFGSVATINYPTVTTVYNNKFLKFSAWVKTSAGGKAQLNIVYTDKDGVRQTYWVPSLSPSIIALDLTKLETPWVQIPSDAKGVEWNAAVTGADADMWIDDAYVTDIPNCSNVTGPTLFGPGQNITFEGDFSAPVGNAAQILLGKNGTVDVSSPTLQITSNNQRLAFNFTTPSTLSSDPYDIYCRVWNDGIAEARGNTAYVDQLPRYAAEGPGGGYVAGRVANTYNFSGTLVYYSVTHPGGDIYSYNLASKTIRQLTDRSGSNTYPSFSRDGSKILFQSNRDGNNEIYLMNSNGSGQTNLSKNAGDDVVPIFSPSGSTVFFGSDRDKGLNKEWDIYSMDTSGGQVKRITTTASDKNTWVVDISKDGN
ncbi:PD40 domain-containing protein, partial [Candidatus Roizmanbacteria bacterium]|nr:PD40 domain-containing protein [Candidatus Roizmanbacteria bacterium]